MIDLSVTHDYPDQRFWDSYSELWLNSIHPSPFQSPSFLQYLAGANAEYLVLCSFFDNEKLVAATFFKNDNGTLVFLSDIKSDYNFFTISKNCDKKAIQSIFRIFLDAVKKNDWSLKLNYQPSWASYMDAFAETGKQSEVFWELSKHSVCPALVCETPKEVLDRFNKMKNMRYYVNRLKKQQSAEFEVFSDDTDLDAWTEEFCACHTKRWTGTPTPSKYDSPKFVDLAKGCFRAWAEDGLLHRFSIRVGTERIAFNIALHQENALVGHSQAYDPDYGKYSPGKALMYFIGQWMCENKISKIDFGKGGEAYKADMTNVDYELNKIFISSYSNIGFIIKSKLEKTARSNSNLIRIYRGKLKPTLQQARLWVRMDQGSPPNPASLTKEAFINSFFFLVNPSVTNDFISALECTGF
jgi:hypothetical protein